MEERQEEALAGVNLAVSSDSVPPEVLIRPLRVSVSVSVRVTSAFRQLLQPNT